MSEDDVTQEPPQISGENVVIANSLNVQGDFRIGSPKSLIFVLVAILLAATAGFIRYSIVTAAEPEYSLYLDSEFTPFEQSFTSGFAAPFDIRTKQTKSFEVPYYRRNPEFRPQAIAPFLKEISDVSKEEAIEEIRGIPGDTFLRESLLDDDIFALLTQSGDFIDRQLRSSYTDSGVSSETLAQLFDTRFRHGCSTAAFYMLHAYEGYRPIIETDPNTFLRDVQNVWPKRGGDVTPKRESFRLSNCLLLRITDPVFLIAVRNNCREPVVVSRIHVDASLITQAASGTKSGPLHVLDTVSIALSGKQQESVDAILDRPVQIAPEETAAVRVIISSPVMFSYRIELAVYDDQKQLHCFEPLIIDYFTEER